MTHVSRGVALTAALVLLLAVGAGRASAQYQTVSYYSLPPAPPAPVVSYYAAPAPVVSYYSAPAPVVSYYAAPTVSYYAAPTVSYYSAPAVSYYAAPTVAYYPAPATAVTTYRYGLFGRPRVATSYYYYP